MITITASLEKNLAIEQEKVGNIQKQLGEIDKKLDSLINIINDHNVENIQRYNELAQRVVSLEAGKEQTKYIITIISILLVGLDFLLKYVIK